MAAIDPDEQEQLLAQERLDAQRRRTALMVVLAGVGVVLALAAGVLAYAMTRGDSPTFSAQITTTPVPVPRRPPAAPPAAETPAPTESTAREVPDRASSDEAGTADVAPTGQSPTPTTASDLALAPGNPAGSGCTPGPGESLPDGQWVGYVVEHDAAALRFDLVCYDSATGTVTNQNTALREGPLAGDVTVLCGTLTCNLATIRPSTLTVVDVAGGAVQRVRAGVGPGAPSPRPDRAQESPG